MGDKLVERGTVERDLGIPMEEKMDIKQQCTLTAQKTKYIPALLQKRSVQQVKGGGSPPQLCPREAPPESSAQERYGAVGVGPEESHKGD